MTRLLLVDDEADIRETMVGVLAMLMPDVEVSTASNGDEALRMLDAGRFDALLTDYKMPVMDGATLAERVRKRWPQLPTLMFTAFLDPRMAEDLHARVPDLKVIPKPLDIDFLVRQLRETLEG